MDAIQFIEIVLEKGGGGIGLGEQNFSCMKFILSVLQLYKKNAQSMYEYH